MKLSLRLRLTFWYTTIVAITLALFGFLNYATVSQELTHNLDSSILRVAESLEFIIKQKQQETKQPLKPAQSQSGTKKKKKKDGDKLAFFRTERLRTFVGPIRPETAGIEPSDVVWSAVYEHILLNPKNYMIQVADTSNEIIWRSDNLLPDSLPLPVGYLPKDAQPYKKTVLRHVFGKQTLRLFLYHTPEVQISVGYPVEEIDNTLNDLFSSLVIALPAVLLISTIGGWFLAKYSLQPIEDITRLAQDITAHNLSQRLVVPSVDDEISRLSETLNDMISRLEASFKQVSQFTGDASHELRTPLAIMMGELEIALRSERNPEEYQQIISSALDEVIRLSKVVEDLLELSRAESGQVEMTIGRVNVSNLLQDISEDAMILAEMKNIIVHFDSEQDIKIFGDKGRLHQAFLNIIDNAIKYTPDGGEIFIDIHKEGNEAEISVQDSGVGIAKDDILHIFDRFYRADKARSSMEVRGHGLGLSIVRWIIDAHLGTINVTSDVGKGTTFTVRLPLDMLAKRAEEEE